MSDIETVAAQPIVVASPFGQSVAAPQDRSANVEIAAQREIAEVQAHLIMAHRMPHAQMRAMDRIIQACTRPTLAQSALYTYSRGGTEITGPSIRLAEVLAQNWGNLKFGWREVERKPAERDPVTGRWRPGRSTISTYCTDLESNVTDERSFQMMHERSTKAGTRPLEDDRDIYEAAANQAARRMRACILAIIPGDIAETAQEQCEATMLAREETTPESVGKLVKAFERFGVRPPQIEQRIQRRLDSIRPAQVVGLRKIWKSLDDGMSVATDWFQATEPAPGEVQQPAPAAKGNEGLKARLRPQQPAQATTAPADDLGPTEAATPVSDDGMAGGMPLSGDATGVGDLVHDLHTGREPGEEG
jgi:hypothetical protein